MLVNRTVVLQFDVCRIRVAARVPPYVVRHKVIVISRKLFHEVLAETPHLQYASHCPLQNEREKHQGTQACTVTHV